MEIDELIDKKRWFKSYEREKVSDYIAKDATPDMSAVNRNYAPIIDGILTDYKLDGEYAIYQEDGHDFMTFRASECNSACDKYQSSQDGDFIIIQLDAINKECGSAGYGSAGMSNARYSDKKTEKSSENVTFRTRWGDLTIPMTINIGGEEVEYEGFDASGNSCRSPEGKSPHKIEYRKGEYYVIVDLDNSKVSFGREGSMWYNSEDYTYLESIKGLIEHGEYYINSPYVTKSKTKKSSRADIERFIDANKEYFKDLVREFGFGEVHGYVEKQVDWYLYCLNHPEERDELWQGIKDKMGNAVIDYEDFDTIARMIWNKWYDLRNTWKSKTKKNEMWGGHSESDGAFINKVRTNGERISIETFERPSAVEPYQESTYLYNGNKYRIFDYRFDPPYMELIKTKKSNTLKDVPDIKYFEKAQKICDELKVVENSTVHLVKHTDSTDVFLEIPKANIPKDSNIKKYEGEESDKIVSINLDRLFKSEKTVVKGISVIPDMQLYEEIKSEGKYLKTIEEGDSVTTLFGWQSEYETKYEPSIYEFTFVNGTLDSVNIYVDSKEVHEICDKYNLAYIYLTNY